MLETSVKIYQSNQKMLQTSVKKSNKLFLKRNNFVEKMTISHKPSTNSEKLV